MQDKTQTGPQQAAKIESNDQMTSMKAPAFSLTADGAGDPKSKAVEGGGDGYVTKVSEVGSPLKTVPISFPGQVAWVHSPCFSQELEAAALQAADGQADFDATSAYVAKTIEMLSSTAFKNAGGKENDWAARMMGKSVPMNSENKAATLWGGGYPKLIVLTFWNDPANPETGGVNYGYFVEIKFPLELIDEGGGIIFVGSRGGIDLSRLSREVAQMNSFMSTILDMLQRMTTVRPDFKKMKPKEQVQALKELFQRYKEGMDAGGAVKNLQEGVSDANAAAQDSKDTFIEIKGKKLEKGKRYDMQFSIGNDTHSAFMTPDEFMNQYGVQYKSNQVRFAKIEELK